MVPAGGPNLKIFYEMHSLALSEVFGEIEERFFSINYRLITILREDLHVDLASLYSNALHQ